MKITNRLIVFLLVVLFAFAETTIVFAQGPSAAEYGVVLNLSGKQRMLSQKMSKEVMLINLNYKKDINLENLKKTASLFDKTLKGLRNGDDSLGLPPTTSRRILRQIDDKITPLWESFYGNIQSIVEAGNISSEQLAAVAQNNLPLLKEMNKCVKLYEKDASKAGMKSDPGLAVTINLAGKQRMLTQKMSKEFLLIANAYSTEENRLNLQETSGLFARTLKGLLDGDTTLDLPGTKEESIRTQLQNVESLWKGFKPSVEFAITEQGTIPEDKIGSLAEQNLPLLKEMNKAVEMYEAQASK